MERKEKRREREEIEKRKSRKTRAEYRCTHTLYSPAGSSIPSGVTFGFCELITPSGRRSTGEGQILKNGDVSKTTLCFQDNK
jgi:hypothetical protein